MGVIIAIIILGIIITIHEFGHFIMAKIFNVPVREFSVGMGPRIFSKVWHNTRYSLKALPLGGSCSLIGEDAAGSGDFTKEEGVVIDDEGMIDFEGVKFTKEEIEKNNFAVINPIKKFFICVAGPFMNFLLAFVLAMFLVQETGFDVPVIAEIAENSAAADAMPFALEAGDEIVELEVPGSKEKIIAYRDILLFLQIYSSEISEKKLPLAITFKRNEETYKTIVYPRYDEKLKRSIIGISFSTLQKTPNGIVDTFKMAGKEFYFYIKTTVMSLRLLISGKFGVKDMSGPVGAVAVMGSAINESAAGGVSDIVLTVMMLTILLSSNLGVMNLLPIPALDGGRIVFAAIEMIIGRPIDKNIEGVANSITLILLLILMAWIFGMDIYKLMTGTLY